MRKITVDGTNWEISITYNKSLLLKQEGKKRMIPFVNPASYPKGFFFKNEASILTDDIVKFIRSVMEVQP